MPPHMIYGGPSAASYGNAGHMGQMAGSRSAPPPGPEFTPGELLNIEGTVEDGRFESETQERGAPPPPFYAAAVGPAASYGNAGHMGHMAGSRSALPPRPKFIPGELLNIEGSVEDGHFESETQERGAPPPPPPPYAAAVGPAESSLSPRVPMMPHGSLGYFYPYNWMLITGQYPPGTYTHSSSSVEHGGNDWQENHYIGYDYPAEEPAQQMQSFPSGSAQSYQQAEPEGPGKGQDVEQQFQAFAGQWVG